MEFSKWRAEFFQVGAILDLSNTHRKKPSLVWPFQTSHFLDMVRGRLIITLIDRYV